MLESSLSDFHACILREIAQAAVADETARLAKLYYCNIVRSSVEARQSPVLFRNMEVASPDDLRRHRYELACLLIELIRRGIGVSPIQSRWLQVLEAASERCAELEKSRSV